MQQMQEMQDREPVQRQLVTESHDLVDRIQVLEESLEKARLLADE